VRVYLPATLPLLTQWLAAGEATMAATAPGDLGYAVTPTLREWYREADLDELEHAAQLAAAAGSLELLAADPAAPPRRIVVAADVEDSAVSPAPERGRACVRVAGPVAVARWGSGLVDDDGAAAVVEPAAQAVAAAAAGDDDAQFMLDEADAHELGWYAVQELRRLAEGAG
jgi:hypothetical protein